jgi:hypothetical protein
MFGGAPCGFLIRPSVPDRSRRPGTRTIRDASTMISNFGFSNMITICRACPECFRQKSKASLQWGNERASSTLPVHFFCRPTNSGAIRRRTTTFMTHLRVPFRDRENCKVFTTFCTTLPRFNCPDWHNGGHFQPKAGKYNQTFPCQAFADAP